MIGPDAAVRYLGVKVSPLLGLKRPDIVGQISDWVERIGRAKLKPTQRVSLLVKHAISRVIYAADHCELGLVTLNTADRIIRKAVKTWLHLPQSTCDGLLYARNRDGGLGVQKLSRLIPSIQARRLFRMAGSSVVVTRKLMSTQQAYSKFVAVWKRAGGAMEDLPSFDRADAKVSVEGSPPSPVTPRCPMPCNWRREEFLRWAGLPTQGMGILGFAGSAASNAWLVHPERMQQRHFIAALQLRANVYPTREFQCRGRERTAALCRHCSLGMESCSHLLSVCPSTQRSRIRRHHKLCDLLAGEAERCGWTVYREKSFRMLNGTLGRPDLVLVRAGEALVVDVTVRFEYAPDTLKSAAAEKSKKYGCIRNEVAGCFDVRSVRDRKSVV